MDEQCSPQEQPLPKTKDYDFAELIIAYDPAVNQFRDTSIKIEKLIGENFDAIKQSH
jgi:hypothetical protein